jgi:hypothetical protein
VVAQRVEKEQIDIIGFELFEPFVELPDQLAGGVGVTRKSSLRASGFA